MNCGFHHYLLAWLFVTGACVASGQAQLPETILKDLVSEDFSKRETAQDSLSDWAADHEENAPDYLYQLSREHPEAEVRVRSLEVLRRIVRQIYEAEGEGYVGIRMQDEMVQLPGQNQETPVVRVFEVMPDSPAAVGGLMVGDVIYSLNGKRFQQMSATEGLRSTIKSIKPHTEITLQVLRGKDLVEIRVKLARRPAAAENPFDMPDQHEIEAVENQSREAHFRKWLLDRSKAR